ncbi:hypothetical protein Enr13x_33590 [Stieleria neptunia]|uniref:Uncharacterized protein n=1 Tax=Stieleria neptunia TaxID=2527979 RepID=A0A518HRM1_9BACT|nr:hypothetical protein [Stieleria neptunia]QDV43502.1 hypothetical protein Enr13x_33590 [Stieleria neptunia]
MKLRLTNQLYGAVAVLALVASAGNALAQGESFIVASQVVSDTALPAEGGYIGDLASASISDSGCSSCQSGECATCQSGSCGTCSSGDCGGGVLGKLANRCGDANCSVCRNRQYDHSDLFYNFYSGGNCNTANAQMYVSPVPVPHFVGHTFNTYQPLYPHEFLYKHKDRYHNNYDDGRGINRTKVRYSYPPIKQAVSNLYWNKLRLPR